jgi:hypothetical protein
MKTIVYQGRPSESAQWMVLNPEFVRDFKRLDYEIQELVLRDDAEQAKAEHFNAAIERAVTLIVEEVGSVAAAPVAKKLRDLKLKTAVKS